MGPWLKTLPINACNTIISAASKISVVMRMTPKNTCITLFGAENHGIGVLVVLAAFTHTFLQKLATSAMTNSILPTASVTVAEAIAEEISSVGKP